MEEQASKWCILHPKGMLCLPWTEKEESSVLEQKNVFRKSIQLCLCNLLIVPLPPSHLFAELYSQSCSYQAPSITAVFEDTLIVMDQAHILQSVQNASLHQWWCYPQMAGKVSHLFHRYYSSFQTQKSIFYLLASENCPISMKCQAAKTARTIYF